MKRHTLWSTQLWMHGKQNRCPHGRIPRVVLKSVKHITHDISVEVGKPAPLSTWSPSVNFSSSLEHKSIDVCGTRRASSTNKVEFLRVDIWTESLICSISSESPSIILLSVLNPALGPSLFCRIVLLLTPPERLDVASASVCSLSALKRW